MSKTLELTISRKVAASRVALFEAWLSAEMLKKFMTPGPGMTVPRAEVDPREGGAFLVVMKAGDHEIPHSGEYKTIRRHDRLAFTWISPHSTPDSLVTLDFADTDDGGTEITLHHVGLADEESRDNHTGGWGTILEALARVSA